MSVEVVRDGDEQARREGRSGDWRRRRAGPGSGGGSGSRELRDFPHSRATLPPGSAPRRPLLEELRHQIRLRHLALSTERSYLSWVRQLILFHGKRHPSELSSREIEAFLGFLASERKVASSTQNQALNAIVFLYRHVVGRSVGDLSGLVRAKRTESLPVVLTPGEVERVLARLEGDAFLVALLLWGSGLRLLEALRLRVKDVDFDRLRRHARGGARLRANVRIGQHDRHVLAGRLDHGRLVAHLCLRYDLRHHLGQGIGL